MGEDVSPRAQTRVYTTRTLDSWWAERIFAETSLEQVTFFHPCPTSRHPIWGVLYLDLLEELVHQGGLMREGVRQIGDLLGQVLLAIWIGRVWIMGVSMCGGSIVDCMYKT